MKVYHKKGFFFCECSYQERHLPNDAFFVWSSKLKLWYTNRISSAAVLRPYFNKDTEELFKSFTIINTEQKISGAILPIGKTLMPHQIEAFNFAMSKNHSYLALEQRLGKTPTTIAVLNSTLSESLPNLIICPSFLVLHWKRELKEWSVMNYSSVVTILNEKGELSNKPKPNSIFILPDSLLQSPDVNEYLRFMNFNNLVVDEAQRFISIESKRTVNLLGTNNLSRISNGLVHRAKKVILLSGTPIKNSILDYYHPVRALAHNTINYRTFDNFAERYSIKTQKFFMKNKYAFKYSGEKNVDELNKKLSNFIIYQTLKGEGLKDKVDLEMLVPIEGNKTKKIKLLEKEILTSKPIKEIIGSSQEGKLSTFRKEIVPLKLKPSAEFIDNLLDKNKKLLVFCIHIEAVKGLEKILKNHNPLIIYGATSKKDRDKIVKDFQGGKSSLLIANIHTMVGLDLSKADTCVFFESSWTPADNNQARSRAQSIAKNKSVTSYHLALADSLDEYVLQVVLKKQKTVSLTNN